MLKLYKKIMRVCIVLTAVFVVLSIAISVLQSDGHWMTLIENYFVGIACSSIIVIITTYFQFEKERRDTEAEFISSVRCFLFEVMCVLPHIHDDDVNDEWYNNFYEQIEKTISAAQEASKELFSVSKKYKNDMHSILLVQIELLKKYSDRKSAIQSIVTADLIKPVIEVYLSYETSDGILRGFPIDLEDELSKL